MAKLLTSLLRMDRTSVFLAVLVVALIGLFVPSWPGALILYVVVAALATLLSRTWRVTPSGHLAFRLAVLAILAVIATSKLFA
jgi:uncharacterized protein YqgC (DUF456 family)